MRETPVHAPHMSSECGHSYDMPPISRQLTISQPIVPAVMLLPCPSHLRALVIFRLPIRWHQTICQTIRITLHSSLLELSRCHRGIGRSELLVGGLLRRSGIWCGHRSSSKMILLQSWVVGIIEVGSQTGFGGGFGLVVGIEVVCGLLRG
jgi:hypothetical protein